MHWDSSTRDGVLWKVESYSGNKKLLPLSMRPNLLERAFNTSDRIAWKNDPTGLHCLLCNGPALSSRTGFGGITTGIFSSSSSDGDDDDDDDAKGKNLVWTKESLPTTSKDILLDKTIAGRYVGLYIFWNPCACLEQVRPFLFIVLYSTYVLYEYFLDSNNIRNSTTITYYLFIL